MIAAGHARAFLIAVNVLAVGVLPAVAQDDEAFMPKGGKTLFLELMNTPRAVELRDIGNRPYRAGMANYLSPRHKQLSEREASELAAYLAVNFPLPEGAVAQAGSQNDVASALPPDGRELAWTQCQFCHSLFSGYLMQQRDVQGWRSVFLSPFHRNLKMTTQQRETLRAIQPSTCR